MRIVKTYPRYLQPYVRSFYTVQANEAECSSAAHRRLPDGTLDMVFNLGAPVLLSRDGNCFREMPAVAVTGLHPDRSFLLYTGAVHLVGVVFQPGAAHLFVHDNLEQFRECTYHAEDVLGHPVMQLLQQLSVLKSVKERHALLEQYLIQLLQGNKDEYHCSRIIQAVQQVHTANGAIEMSALHKDNWMSERHFRRKFQEYVGMSPKQYAGIVRVKTFSQLYERSRLPYSRILSELGYADQSHFSKDFRKIAGTGPTEYFSQLNKMGEQFIHLI